MACPCVFGPGRSRPYFQHDQQQERNYPRMHFGLVSREGSDITNLRLAECQRSTGKARFLCSPTSQACRTLGASKHSCWYPCQKPDVGPTEDILSVRVPELRLFLIRAVIQ